MNLKRARFHQQPLEEILLLDPRDSLEFAVGVPTQIHSMFGERRLEELAPCITGISTGNDKKYIRRSRAKGFEVPFYKNPASRKFYADPDGFLCSNYQDVARAVPNFMIRNKGLLFRGGLSCSSMGVKFGATLRPEGTACGVNPNVIVDGEVKWWLLSYLNSKLCLYLTRGVIIRANMITAGYAARIPRPKMSKATLARLAKLGREGFDLAKASNDTSSITSAINSLLASELQLPESIISLLDSFERDPVRLS
jgi:hypothetical protein